VAKEDVALANELNVQDCLSCRVPLVSPPCVRRAAASRYHRAKRTVGLAG